MSSLRLQVTLILALLVAYVDSSATAAIIFRKTTWELSARADGEYGLESNKIPVSDRQSENGILTSLDFFHSISAYVGGNGTGSGFGALWSTQMLDRLEVHLHGSGSGEDTGAGSFEGSGGGGARAVMNFSVLSSTVLKISRDEGHGYDSELEYLGYGGVFSPYWETGYDYDLTLVPGTYRLSLEASGSGRGDDFSQSYSPTTLRATFYDSSISFIPEASTWAMSSLVFLGAAFIIQRR